LEYEQLLGFFFIIIFTPPAGYEFVMCSSHVCWCQLALPD